MDGETVTWRISPAAILNPTGHRPISTGTISPGASFMVERYADGNPLLEDFGSGRHQLADEALAIWGTTGRRSTFSTDQPGA